MGKYFRTIYLYIVVFATLCMVITGFVGAIHSIVAYKFPVVDEYYLEDYYKDSDTYEAKLENLENMEKRTNLKSTFTYLAVLVCGMPLYLFHVKQIIKESEREV